LCDAQKQLLGYMDKFKIKDIDWGQDMFGSVHAQAPEAPQAALATEAAQAPQVAQSAQAAHGAQGEEALQAMQAAQTAKVVQDMQMAQDQARQRVRERDQDEVDSSEDSSCKLSLIERGAKSLKRLKISHDKTKEREKQLREELEGLAQKRSALEAEEKKQFVVFGELFKEAKVELEKARVQCAAAEDSLKVAETRVAQERISANSARLNLEALEGEMRNIHDMLYGVDFEHKGRVQMQEGEDSGKVAGEDGSSEGAGGEAEHEERAQEQEVQGDDMHAEGEEGKVSHSIEASRHSQIPPQTLRVMDDMRRLLGGMSASSSGGRVRHPNFSPGQQFNHPPQVPRMPFPFSSTSRSPSPRRTIFSMQGTPNR
jgi:hypothetical protein